MRILRAALSCLAGMREPGLMRRILAELAHLEREVLGRTRPDAARSVHEALAICGVSEWCGGCGRALIELRVAGAVPMDRVGERCQACGLDPPFEGFVRLGRYASPLDQLVRRMKANAWHDVAESLGRALANSIRASIELAPDQGCVVPIPTSPLRRIARGIDHASVMGRAVAEALGLPFKPCLRSRLSPRQAALAGLDRRQRLRRFAWRAGRSLPKGVSVILVDDIRTTGSTLIEARELLRQRGAGSVIPAVACVVD